MWVIGWCILNGDRMIQVQGGCPGDTNPECEFWVSQPTGRSEGVRDAKMAGVRLLLLSDVSECITITQPELTLRYTCGPGWLRAKVDSRCGLGTWPRSARVLIAILWCSSSLGGLSRNFMIHRVTCVTNVGTGVPYLQFTPGRICTQTIETLRHAVICGGYDFKHGVF